MKRMSDGMMNRLLAVTLSVLVLTGFGAVYTPALAQGNFGGAYSTATKSCGACGKPVPASSQVGDYCPHCGVRWGFENSRTDFKTIPAPSVPRFEPPVSQIEPPVAYETYAPSAPRLRRVKACIRVDGQTLRLGQSPVFHYDGRLLVPLRALFEALGYSVAYDAADQSVLAERDALPSGQVAFTIGEFQMTVNGEARSQDVAPRVVRGRVYVPLRALAESIGATIAVEESDGSWAVSVTSRPIPVDSGE